MPTPLLAARRTPARARRAGPPAQRRGRGRAWEGLVRGAGRRLADRRPDGRRRRRASRCSTFVQAPAARRWRSPRSMRNTGQVYAYDDDAARLRPIFERLKRAGARNVQVLPGGRRRQALAALGPRFDRRFHRCPLHRHGRLASAARCQMAAEAGQSRAAPVSEQRAILSASGAAGEARRPARLRHLLGAAGGEWRPGCAGSWRTIRTSRRCLGVESWAAGVGGRAAGLRRRQQRGAAAHPRPPRHRWVLHRGDVKASAECGGTAPDCASSLQMTSIVHR